jgi:hypothetical protein
MRVTARRAQLAASSRAMGCNNCSSSLANMPASTSPGVLPWSVGVPAFTARSRRVAMASGKKSGWRASLAM